MIFDMIQGKKILITGVSGQCGRGLAFVLAKKNEVHGVARFSKPEVREEVERNGAVAWTMDMGVERPDRLPRDFDIVIHEAVAWEGDDDLKVQDQSFHLSCQFVGDLMYRCQKATFALISTGSVYKHIDGLCKEDETPVQGHNTYTLAKICMMQVARWIGTTFDRPWTILHYYFPFAPYSPHPKVDRALAGDFHGNPAGAHQRTYIQNHLFNTLRALDYAKPAGEIFNSVTTEEITQGLLYQAAAKAAGKPVPPGALEPGTPPSGPRHVGDTTKIKRLLGASPISIEEGLRRYHRAQVEQVLTPADWMFADE